MNIQINHKKDKRIQDKLLGFKYFLYRLIHWYKEVENNSEIKSNIDKLKIFKLLFLVSTAKSTEQNLHLLEKFDNFVAMPLGPVELDIFNSLKKSDLNEFLSNTEEQWQEEFSNNPLDKEWKEQIDEAISKLYQENKLLITYKSSRLVDITHKWFSWRHIYYNHRNNNELIPMELIANDTKFYN